ncbi:MAG: hypothetical protein LBQ83_05225 [Candidatus Margulisbacteria bacterium]|jgi:hypothetical protein|nr:hypothetical protein [Candidatus Margulisiibacteriota bacterium]
MFAKIIAIDSPQFMDSLRRAVKTIQRRRTAEYSLETSAGLYFGRLKITGTKKILRIEEIFLDEANLTPEECYSLKGSGKQILGSFWQIAADLNYTEFWIMNTSNYLLMNLVYKHLSPKASYYIDDRANYTSKTLNNFAENDWFNDRTIFVWTKNKHILPYLYSCLDNTFRPLSPQSRKLAVNLVKNQLSFNYVSGRHLPSEQIAKINFSNLYADIFVPLP